MVRIRFRTFNKIGGSFVNINFKEDQQILELREKFRSHLEGTSLIQEGSGTIVFTNKNSTEKFDLLEISEDCSIEKNELLKVLQSNE